MSLKYHLQNNQKGGKSVVVKPHQATPLHARRQITEHVMSPAPNQDSLTNSGTIKYFIQRNSVGEIKTAVLRFQVRMDTASATLVPTPFWFDRIEFHNRTTNTEISRLTAETLFTFLNIVDSETINQWSKLANYNKYSFRSDSQQQFGTTRYYYLPLVASLFEGMGLDLNMVSDEIEIRMHVADGVIVENPSTAQPKLLEIATIFEVNQMSSPDEVAAKEQFHNRYVSVHHFLNSQEYIRTGVVMEPSKAYTVDLDQFNHDSACLLLSIKPTGATNIRDGRQQYMNIDKGSVDVVREGGTNLFGNGAAVSVEYLKQVIAPKYAGSDYWYRVDMVPIMFGNFGAAIHGAIDGYHRFDGSKKRLIINTPPPQTFGVVQVTQSAVVLQGTFKFVYKGEKTNPIAYNATANTINTALNNLQSVKDDNIKLSIDGPLVISPSFNLVTYSSNLIGSPGNQSVEIPALVYIEAGDSTFINSSSSVIVTHPVIGFPSSSTYDITVTSLYFKSIHQDGTRLHVEDYDRKLISKA